MNAAGGSPKKPSAQATPTKAKSKSPTKRKKGEPVHIFDDQSDDDGDGVEDVPSPPKKNRQAAPNYKIKYEDETEVKEEAVQRTEET